MAIHPTQMFGLSLCAGAGGLDLGLHIAHAGYRTVCYVEREAYAAATLVARMEDAALDQAPIWDDITSFDGRPWRGCVDIIHGGYPCQPFSVAGKRLGDKDERHLWPHIARIVREVRPRLCFFENVSGHLRLGYRQVHDDLRRMGYGVAAGLFTAAEVGSPHKRERLFILAYEEGKDLSMGDADDERLEGWSDNTGEHTREQFAWPPSPDDSSGWERFMREWPDLKPAVRRGSDGLACRVDRLRLCGNGVVPMAAAYAFRTLADAAGIGGCGEE